MAHAQELWLGLGRSWKAFWSATPYEVGKVVAALQKQDHRQTVMTGWYTEYFARQKRLKSLSHYLEEPKDKKLISGNEAMQAGPWLALMGVGGSVDPLSDLSNPTAKSR